MGIGSTEMKNELKILYARGKPNKNVSASRLPKIMNMRSVFDILLFFKSISY
jgi:hypothetical protein